MMALRVPYDPADPSSVLNWLERWSLSNVWKPAPYPKKDATSRSHKKQGHFQTAETEPVRPKNSVRRIRGSFDNNALMHSNSESEKVRHTQKKVPSLPSESVPENPQNELEKVKRSLRKVHRTVAESNVQSEAAEKPSESQEMVLGSAGDDVSGPNEMNEPENVKEETAAEVNNTVQETVVTIQPAKVLNTEEHLKASETIEISNGDHTIVKSPPIESCEKDGSVPIANVGELAKDDSPLNENQKSSRRSSFPAKQEREDVPQSTPKLPSYMQATESAKAKLREQNSPRLSQDENDRNHVTRRHSLPSSTNGKVSSSSPRIQRPLHASGKGGNRCDRQVSSARDGKVAQAEWRR